MISENEAIEIAKAHGKTCKLPAFDPLFAKKDGDGLRNYWKVHLQFRDLSEEPSFTVVYVDVESGSASLLSTL